MKYQTPHPIPTKETEMTSRLTRSTMQVKAYMQRPKRDAMRCKCVGKQGTEMIDLTKSNDKKK